MTISQRTSAQDGRFIEVAYRRRDVGSAPDEPVADDRGRWET